ncbi:MAG: rhodanese-like domain-containing protein, partial [Candidatus Marinimicrobia bacterium]|nr:rhodanese-like domain-containing protein [Candidatus Neomarinimicrobiota bacterium]
CMAEDFPYRKDYPDVPVIELEDLKAQYDSDSVVIIDVRSAIEYKTIHPKGAFHISLSNAAFISKLQDLVTRLQGKKVAVYCNGITCLKSYRAAQEAKDAGIANVYAFDAGIPAWTAAYPNETLLLGKEVIDPAKQIIPKSEFKKRALDFETFKQKIAESKNAIVVDARDPIQRTVKLPGFEDAMPIPLDKMIRNVINAGNMKDKELFIFDQVGKQVRWLMYYLKDQGYSNYYFLAGGATAVLHEQVYR